VIATIVKKKKAKQVEIKEAPADREQTKVEASAVDAEAQDQVQQPVEQETPQQKVERLEDALLRSKADFQNFQRRSTIEKSEAIIYANVDLMKSLLHVMDDFERSFQAAESAGSDESHTQGFRLIYENFLKALQQFGLQPIDALYQPFDPAIHEALLQQPCDEHPPSTVIEEVARGYKLRDRVVRPARVIVSKAVESADNPAQTVTEE